MHRIGSRNNLCTSTDNIVFYSLFWQDFQLVPLNSYICSYVNYYYLTKLPKHSTVWFFLFFCCCRCANNSNSNKRRINNELVSTFFVYKHNISQNSISCEYVCVHFRYPFISPLLQLFDSSLKQPERGIKWKKKLAAFNSVTFHTIYNSKYRIKENEKIQFIQFYQRCCSLCFAGRMCVCAFTFITLKCCTVHFYSAISMCHMCTYW